MQFKSTFISFFLLAVLAISAGAQVTERERPAGWDKLVYGGRFMDRFLPISPIGQLSSETWGAADVLPRYIDNGIEEKDWSYWGGNILKGDDGKYHLFVCRWPENAAKGHMEWGNSVVVHTVADNSFGPYRVVQEIGKGHNPEVFQLKDGRFVLYVIGGRYVANSINGPWEYGKFEFDTRDRKIIEGLSNLSFTQREDGSILMVCRGGGIWISEDGLKPYRQISNARVYPPVEGEFEDPVIWKDNVQYNLIVNDWLGRIAWYLRSKDGIDWVVEPGEAYLPGIAVYEDGTKENWYKYERIKMLQDEYGRPIQANFAVIDTIKWEDHGSDTHSSKNIGIPLTKSRLLTVLNRKAIGAKTGEIRVKVLAENDFDPNTDIDTETLRFGASNAVDFGGGSTLLRSEKDGRDLILVFSGKESGLTPGNFAGKLLGKTTKGKLLFGYTRLPEVKYGAPILSAREPKITGNNIEMEVQNFGLESSKATDLEVKIVGADGEITLETHVAALKPYEKTKVVIDQLPQQMVEKPVKIGVYSKGEKEVTLFEKEYKYE